MYILAQILGIIGIISLSISMQYNKKKQILVFKIAANTFYGLQYLCLNAMPAMLMSIVSLVRCVIFFAFENKNKKVPIYVLLIILALIIVTPIFLNYGVMGFFPLIGTLIYTIGTWQKNLNVFRIITLITACIWIGYNVFVGAYSSLIGNVFEVITSLIAIYRFNLNDDKKKKRGKKSK